MQTIRYNMKRLLSIIAAAALSLSLCAAQNRISVGVGPAYGLLISGMETTYSYYESNNLSDLYEPKLRLEGSMELSLEYSRMLSERFSLGANLKSGLTHVARTSAPAYIDKTTEHQQYFFAFAPVARFNLTKPENGVVFYLKAEAGVGMMTGELTGTKWFMDYFVPVGMALGRKFRGFCEVGVGSTSTMRLGFEYDF